MVKEELHCHPKTCYLRFGHLSASLMGLTILGHFTRVELYQEQG